jgi:type IV pilus assembly protein PilX
MRRRCPDRLPALPPRLRRRRARGAALVCALVLMLATMLVAVAISRAVLASVASASAERERGLAREAAEAGLRDAERDIAVDNTAGADPARAARFTPAGAVFIAGCGRGSADRGLCLASSPPAWQVLDLAAAGNPALVPYGHYTGATLATGKGLLPARAPAYLIEKIAPPGATAAMGSFYRITAIGFGSHASTQVVLQSVYRKPLPQPAAAAGGPGEPDGAGNEGGTAAVPIGTGAAEGDGPPGWPGVQDPAGPAPPAPPGPPEPPEPGQGRQAGNGGNGGAGPPPVQLPAGRISWREIVNWSQLHANALK